MTYSELLQIADAYNAALAAEQGAKHHMEACRALLKVPDDEVLYQAIKTRTTQSRAGEGEVAGGGAENDGQRITMCGICHDASDKRPTIRVERSS
jgi:hypothetical protein